MDFSEKFELLIADLQMEAEYFIAPLDRALSNPLYLYRYLHTIGWDVDRVLTLVPDELSEIISTATDLIGAVSGLEFNDFEFENIDGEVTLSDADKAALINVINAFKNAHEQIESTVSGIIEVNLSDADDVKTVVAGILGINLRDDEVGDYQEHFTMLAKELAIDVGNHLLMTYFARRMPVVFQLSRLFGLIIKQPQKALYIDLADQELALLYEERATENPEPPVELPIRFSIETLAINTRGIQDVVSLPVGILFENMGPGAFRSFDAFILSVQSTFTEIVEDIYQSMIENISNEVFELSIDFSGITLQTQSLLPVPEDGAPIEIPLTDTNTPNITIDNNGWHVNWGTENSVPTPLLGQFLFLLTTFSDTYFHKAPGAYLVIDNKANTNLLYQFILTLGIRLNLSGVDNDLGFQFEFIKEQVEENTEEIEGLLFVAKAFAINDLTIPLSLPLLEGLAFGATKPEMEITVDLYDGQALLSIDISLTCFFIYLPITLFKTVNEDREIDYSGIAPKVKFQLVDNNIIPEETNQRLLRVGLDITVNPGQSFPVISVNEFSLLKLENKKLKVSADRFYIGPEDNTKNGFVIEVQEFEISLPSTENPENIFDNGISINKAVVFLPNVLPELPETLELDDAHFNKSGFSGRISAVFDVPPKSEEPKKLFGVIPIQFRFIALEIVDNWPTTFELESDIELLYFEEWVSLTIGIDSEFNIQFKIQSTDPDGIVLTKEELLSLTFRSAGFSYQHDQQLLELSFSGGFEPLLWNLDGLEWPQLDVYDLMLQQDLSAISPDNFEPPIIKFREAWMDLKELATLDLFGFHFELNRIGAGYIEESDKMWIDLTGSLRLIDQIPVGLGVDGFRITWPRRIYEDLIEDGQIVTPKNISLDDALAIASKIEVKFDGVYLFFGIPQTIEFEGFIRFIKEPQKIGFAGDVALRLPSTGLAIEAGLMVGMVFEDPPYPFLYVYFGILLPSGIPLGQSGLALKGAKGLFGLNVEPDKTPEQNPYYDWYKRGPIEGAHPTNKWRDSYLSVALGAGITITTTDGKILGIQGLLALVIPGPIIMVEGKALVFDGFFPIDSPLKALGYFDGNELTVQFNIEAAIELIEDVIDVNAGIEAFFDFKDLKNWHLYLGKDEPLERRVHANFLKLPLFGWLFEGNCYLMLYMQDEDTLRSDLGVFIGFEPPSIDLVVASAEVRAVINGVGLVTINPFQFSGDLNFDAVVDVNAFGFNLVGIEASAGLAAEGALPFIVDAEIACHVDLPFPDSDDIPIVGNYFDDVIEWFEENVTELPEIPEYIEFEIPFHWEFDRAPVLDPLIQEITVESQFSPGGGSIVRSSLSDTNSLENHLHKSRHVPLDATPTIVFDQNMNQPESFLFGGYLSNGVHTFNSGSLSFIPGITRIALYRRARDEQSWEEIASTDADLAEKILWGMYRAEKNTNDGDKASKRVLDLLRTNPFDYMLQTVPLAIPADRPANDQISVPFIDSFLLNESYQLSSDRQIATTCIDESDIAEAYKTHNNGKTNIFRVRKGDKITKQIEIKSVLIYSYSLVLNQPDHSRGYTISAINPSILTLHFPELVTWVELQFIDNNIGTINFQAFKAGVPVFSEYNPHDNNKGKAYITLPGVCSERVNNIDRNQKERSWTIKNSDGFQCLEIYSRKNYLEAINITQICWQSRNDQIAVENLTVQEDVNRKILDELVTQVPLLVSNSFYKIQIEYDIALDVQNTEDSVLALYENMPTLFGSIREYMQSENGPLQFVEAQYFQTSGPPQNLNSYVKWISSTSNNRRHFLDDDFVIRFNRSYIHRLYPDQDNSSATGDFPYKIQALLKDSHGNIIEGFFHNWTRSASATLMDQEKKWYDYANNTFNSDIENPPDDILELRKYLFAQSSLNFGLANWEVITLGSNSSERAKWKIDNNGVINIGNKMFTGRQSLPSGGSMYVAGDTHWENYAFQFSMDVSKYKHGISGAIFLYESKSNHYRIELSKYNKSGQYKVALVAIKDGLRKTLKMTKLNLSHTTIIPGNANLTSRFIRNSPVPDLKLASQSKSLKLSFKVSVFSSQRGLDITCHFPYTTPFMVVESSPVSTKGKIGFLNVGSMASFSDIVVSAGLQELTPDSQYEMLLIGGEGGQTLVNELFSNGGPGNQFEYNNNSWNFEEKTAQSLSQVAYITYKKSVDDFEFITSIKLKANDKIAYQLRVPSNDDKSKDYYEISILRQNDHDKYIYSTKLEHKKIGYDISMILLQSDVEFADVENLYVRIRFIGNEIKVWLFEKEVISIRLKKTDILTVKSQRFSTGNGSILQINGPTKTDLKKPIIFKKSLSGKLGVRVISGTPTISKFEIRDAAIFKSKFTTSMYNSVDDLIKIESSTIQEKQVGNIDITDNIADALASQQVMVENTILNAKAEIDYAGKVINRENLETLKQLYARSSEDLDKAVISLLDDFDDLAYLPQAIALQIIKIVNPQNEVYGFLIRSPEPLEPLRYTLAQNLPYQTIGRTEFVLSDSVVQSEVPVYWISSSDGTLIFLYSTNNTADTQSAGLPVLMSNQPYELQVTYIRDLQDEMEENFDHSYDRPYLLSKSSKQSTTLKKIFIP